MTPEKKTWLILCGITAAEAVPLVIYTVQGPARFARYLGFRNTGAATLSGWVLALCVAALYTGASALRLPAIRGHFFQLDAMKFFALLVFAPVTGIFEEMYFRKALMDAVLAPGGGLLLQVILSALIFGAAHGIWGFFGRSVRIALGATVATALLGALLAVVYGTDGRSVAPCIVSHALINACLEPWLILAAASRSWRGVPAQPRAAGAIWRYILYLKPITPRTRGSSG